jgi:hypothetical protein
MVEWCGCLGRGTALQKEYFNQKKKKEKKENDFL